MTAPIFTAPVDVELLHLADPAALVALAALLEDERTHDVAMMLTMDVRSEHDRHPCDVDSGVLLSELARRLRVAAKQVTL